MAVRFNINFSASQARKKEQAREQEELHKLEVEKAKEYSRKYPDRYFPVIDAVDIPLPKEGQVASLLRIIVQRDGNDDLEDCENVLCMDARLYIKRPDDADFIPTKKGIHIPYELMGHFASTLQEIVDDIEAKRANGEKF